jgi:branched-chain amino acid transport system ATP-binding protein
MNVLETKNVCRYFGGIKAVDGVNLKVGKGEVFGIIGPNGAGKTTFFNVCSGTIAPTSGEIWLRGENITKMRPEMIARRGMARTFQTVKLFKYMTVLENIKIGFHIHTNSGVLDALLHSKRYQRDEKVAGQKGMEILKITGLSEYQDWQAGNLPYGLQRKVEIARALALKPEILLLDEPAAGMNPHETWSLLEFLKKLNTEGYTIIVIEHDMKFVMNLCDRVLVLNFGKKICEGTPHEVRNNQEVCEAYFGKGGLTEGGNQIC